jgi:hypothetical protein
MLPEEFISQHVLWCAICDKSVQITRPLQSEAIELMLASVLPSQLKEESLGAVRGLLDSCNNAQTW